MNVLEARVVLRDRPMLDVVDLAVRFVVKHARTYAVVALLLVLPALLVTLGIARLAGWGWAWTWALAASPFVAAPYTALASRLLFEPKARVSEVLGATLTALPRLIALRLGQLVAVGIGSLLVVPAVWFLALFLFTNEIVVLERARIGDAMSRMQRMLSGNSGDAILAVLFLLALHIAAVFLGDVVGRSVLEDMLEITAPPSLIDARGSGLGLAAFWAFVPFGATCRFLLYINVRTRTEGWDVQTRFAAIAARGQEGDAGRGEAA